MIGRSKTYQMNCNATLHVFEDRDPTPPADTQRCVCGQVTWGSESARIKKERGEDAL